jgi:hypothetical protein
VQPVMVVSVYMVVARSMSYQMGPVAVHHARRSCCRVTVDTSPVAPLDTVHCRIVYNGRWLLWNDFS